MLPHDPDQIDRQTWTWLWAVFVVAVLVGVLACAVFAPPAGAAKRPQPAPPRVCVANVVSQDTGYYRADVNGAPALVFARSTRRPVLRVGCYRKHLFDAEWRVQR